ncbi:MAG TPA: type II toxin-antitoxin system HicA family toxin [Armatimonadota bacterium]
MDYSSSDLIRMVEADGWYLRKVTGSHHHFKHPVKSGIVTIPHPKKSVPKGTVSSILKSAKLR